MSDNYFQSKTVAPESLKGIEKLKPMCSFADQTVTATDLGRFLSRFQGAQLKGSMANFLEEIFPDFVGERILRYESTQLMTTARTSSKGL